MSHDTRSLARSKGRATSRRRAPAAPSVRLSHLAFAASSLARSLTPWLNGGNSWSLWLRCRRCVIWIFRSVFPLLCGIAEAVHLESPSAARGTEEHSIGREFLRRTPSLLRGRQASNNPHGGASRRRRRSSNRSHLSSVGRRPVELAAFACASMRQFD